MMQMQEDSVFGTSSGLRTVRAKARFGRNIVHVFVFPNLSEETETSSSTGPTKTKAESATTATDVSDDVAWRIRAILEACDEESLEAGIESAPAKALTRLVRQCGDAAITELACLLSGQPADLLAGQEVLAWLGQISHSATRSHRRWLLERMLFHEHQTLRYGAIIGLSYLDTHESLVTVRKALRKETSEYLRQLLSQLKMQLEETLANDAFALQGD